MLLKQTKDPGTGTRYQKQTKRVINKNGSFNVKRKGLAFSTRNIYQFLIKMSWANFLLLLFLAYLIINTTYALIYVAIGIEHLHGVQKGDWVHNFKEAFFFSVQTLTTVGYGGVLPIGMAANLVASIEAMSGWLSFALATGLLYGRFSRPSARILFSKKAIMAPYKGKNSFQFRIANKRISMLMEMEASIILTLLEPKGDGFDRKYYELPLERKKILFFPLNWTLVHVIDEKSPLFDLHMEDLEKKHVEFLILVKGFDDTFSQMVHSRHSYLYDEVVWGATFKPTYYTNESGDIIMDMRYLSDYEDAELN